MSHNETAFVFIVESPSHVDLLDGRTEGKALSEALILSNVRGWYSLATSLEMFKQTLTTRLGQALQNYPGMFPIMHFSMHGNQEGISLTNGDQISWDDLRQMLKPLNEAVNDGILICMSSCFGSSGCRMAMHENTDKPFWALIGNSNSAQWDDAAVAYVTFYHQIFKGETVEKSVDIMKIASGDDNFMHFNGNKVKEDWATFMTNQREKTNLEEFKKSLQAIGHSTQ